MLDSKLGTSLPTENVNYAKNSLIHKRCSPILKRPWKMVFQTCSDKKSIKFTIINTRRLGLSCISLVACQQNVQSSSISNLRRIIGTALTQIEGISAVTAHVFFSEVGCEVSKFPKTGLQKPYKCQRCHYGVASHTSVIIIGENEQKMVLQAQSLIQLISLPV